MKIYTIIGGVNGTGKSSLTGVLKAQRSDLGQIIDVDKITAENGGSAIHGGKIALARITECLEKGLSFTQETTLSGRKTELTAASSRERGYSVRLFCADILHRRCTVRTRSRNRHQHTETTRTRSHGLGGDMLLQVGHQGKRTDKTQINMRWLCQHTSILPHQKTG